MQKLAIGSGNLWLELLDSYTAGREAPDDAAPNYGSIRAVLTEQPQLFCLTFNVLTRDDPAAESADTAADVIGKCRARNLPVFECETKHGPRKAWFEEQDQTDARSADLLNRVWIVAFGRRKILITLTCAERHLSHPKVLAAIDDLPRLIASIVERPANSPLTTVELHELDVDRKFVFQTVREIVGPKEKLSRDLADVPRLQRIVDLRLFPPTDADSWLAVGTAWGDILATELGMRWIMSCDKDLGCQPALAFPQSRHSSVLLYPQDMLRSHIQVSANPQLGDLFAETKKHIDSTLLQEAR